MVLSKVCTTWIVILDKPEGAIQNPFRFRECLSDELYAGAPSHWPACARARNFATSSSGTVG
jgi:hypothetical protein